MEFAPSPVTPQKKEEETVSGENIQTESLRKKNKPVFKKWFAPVVAAGSALLAGPVAQEGFTLKNQLEKGTVLSAENNERVQKFTALENTIGKIRSKMIAVRQARTARVYNSWGNQKNSKWQKEGDAVYYSIQKRLEECLGQVSAIIDESGDMKRQDDFFEQYKSIEHAKRYVRALESWFDTWKEVEERFGREKKKQFASDAEERIYLKNLSKKCEDIGDTLTYKVPGPIASALDDIFKESCLNITYEQMSPREANAFLSVAPQFITEYKNRFEPIEFDEHCKHLIAKEAYSVRDSILPE
jgi:hypothetical protein